MDTPLNPPSEASPPPAGGARWWVWALLVLVAGVVAGGIYYSRSIVAPSGTDAVVTPLRSAPPSDAAAGPTATVRVLAATVEVQQPSGSWVAVDGSVTVPAGTRVRTGEKGKAEVTFADQSQMRLNAATEVALTVVPGADAGSTSTELLGGEVWNRIVNLRADSSYEVQSENALALVRGTAFNLRNRQHRVRLDAVQHAVDLRFTGGGTGRSVGEGKALEAPTGGAAPDLAELPLAPLDPADDGAAWREENLRADITYLEGLGERDGAREGAQHARCLLDPADCPPSVTELRAAASDGEATATIELFGWPAERKLHLVWKRAGRTIREQDVTPEPGAKSVSDRAPAKVAGAYTVDLLIDRVLVKTTQFTVEGANVVPTQAPPRSTPPRSTPPRSSTPPVSSTPPASSTPATACAITNKTQCRYGYTYDSQLCIVCFDQPVSSTPSCQDPGQCPYGYTYDATGCRVCVSSPTGASCQDPGTCNYGWDSKNCTCKSAPQAVCGNGSVEGSEQCDPPNGRTCDANCRTIQTIVAPVCGNGVVESGETCEPPNTRTCSASCQSITAVTCSPNCRLPAGLTCTSGGLDCDGDAVCDKCL